MKQKRMYFLMAFLCTLIGYTEWGTQHAYTFQLEKELLFSGFPAAEVLFHPMVIFPLIGQILLLYSALYPDKSKWTALFSFVMLLPLFGLLFFIGLITLHFRILLCALPFMLLSVIYIFHFFKKRYAK